MLRIRTLFALVGAIFPLLVACVETESNAALNCLDDDCEADVSETKTYSDQPDCSDDPLKDNPGICGCGVPDEDTDGDGYMDCVDECMTDPDKLKPGICGCNTSDDDTDRDGLVDCMEECPEDPNKYEAGNCGCGRDEAGWNSDADSDQIPDCLDGCINDPNKDDPGECGCGAVDFDTDGDGVADCRDDCATDPEKTQPGQCGCGIADTNSDNDNIPDCHDNCPHDSNKAEPGTCGCGKTEEECIGQLTLDVDDAMVAKGDSKQNYNGSKMSIDLENENGLTYVLIRPLGFDVIPYGATILSADLEVTVFDGGDKITIHKLLESFDESEVTYKKSPSHSAPMGAMSGKKGPQSTSIASIAQSWADGEPAFGLALYPTGANGTDIYSSEHGDAAERPKITIVFRYPD